MFRIIPKDELTGGDAPPPHDKIGLNRSVTEDVHVFLIKTIHMLICACVDNPFMRMDVQGVIWAGLRPSEIIGLFTEAMADHGDILPDIQITQEELLRLLQRFFSAYEEKVVVTIPKRGGDDFLLL